MAYVFTKCTGNTQAGDALPVVRPDAELQVRHGPIRQSRHLARDCEDPLAADNLVRYVSGIARNPRTRRSPASQASLRAIRSRESVL